MITFTQGDIFKATTDGIVIPVNVMGVMGKGLAAQCRSLYPASSNLYCRFCLDGNMMPGRVYVTSSFSKLPPAYIMYLATKRHWTEPSRLEWIEQGIRHLIEVMKQNNISSVAIPALGCGCGGLSWPTVRNVILQNLNQKDVSKINILIYEPHDIIEKVVS